MDGENNGSKTLLKWMIWGEKPLFLETPTYQVASRISAINSSCAWM